MNCAEKNALHVNSISFLGVFFGGLTVFHESPSGSFFLAVCTTRCCISRQVRSGFASKTSAKIPAASGAAHDVPENESTQCPFGDVVTRLAYLSLLPAPTSPV